jgi:hypothetical protein
MTVRQEMLRNLLLTDFFPGVRSDAAYRPIICQRRRALKGAPVVWGVLAVVPAAFESALSAEVEEFPRPETVDCSRAADVDALLPRRTPLVAVPDGPGNGAGLTALLAERARPSDAGALRQSGGNTVQPKGDPASAPDLALLAQVLRGLRQMN